MGVIPNTVAADVENELGHVGPDAHAVQSFALEAEGGADGRGVRDLAVWELQAGGPLGHLYGVGEHRPHRLRGIYPSLAPVHVPVEVGCPTLALPLLDNYAPDDVRVL